MQNYHHNWRPAAHAVRRSPPIPRAWHTRLDTTESASHTRDRRRVRAGSGPQEGEASGGQARPDADESAIRPALGGGIEVPRNAVLGPSVVYTVVYSGELEPGRAKVRSAWGRLLLEPADAAAYVGITESELVALNQAGKAPAVRIGERLLFRRGDLASLTARLSDRSGRPRKKPAR